LKYDVNTTYTRPNFNAWAPCWGILKYMIFFLMNFMPLIIGLLVNQRMVHIICYACLSIRLHSLTPLIPRRDIISFISYWSFNDLFWNSITNNTHKWGLYHLMLLLWYHTGCPAFVPHPGIFYFLIPSSVRDGLQVPPLQTSELNLAPGSTWQSSFTLEIKVTMGWRIEPQRSLHQVNDWIPWIISEFGKCSRKKLNLKNQ
jgi:hypothetical protein